MEMGVSVWWDSSACKYSIWQNPGHSQVYNAVQHNKPSEMKVPVIST